MHACKASHNVPHRRCLLTVMPVIALFLISVDPLPAQEQSRYGNGAAVTASPLSATRFEGSVPTKGPAGVYALSLRKAIELGLANNLGLLLRKEGVASARGQQWIELSKLLPNLSLGASVHRVQESLAITGITLPGVPTVVGPFDFYDARFFLSQRLFDLEAIRRSRAVVYETAAAAFSEKDAREIVVVSVGAAYLQAVAGDARVATVSSQVATARAILDRTVELHKAGITPGIDELRARVELLTRSQQLIVAENDLAKEKLGLIRLIGLPVGQDIVLKGMASNEPFPVGAVDAILSRAFSSRQDYKSAESLLKAAEASRQAAGAQCLPSLVLDADYGVTGVNPSSMYDTYHIVGSLKLPIFEGGKIHGDVLRAEALVRQRQEELGDLRARIEFEVRTALLDVEAAARQVDVVTKRVELAELSLSQAQERFAAGIEDNLAVVQAQQAVAAAHEGLVSSSYQYNLAKLLLSRAMGTAEEGAAGQGAENFMQ